MTADKMLEAFPQLKQEDISQALSFAAHQFQEIYLPLKAA